MGKRTKRLETRLEDVTSELETELQNAIDFMVSEFEHDWALAEMYYQGGSRLHDTPGRSNVVKTEVRDAIRNTIPSVMRVLLQARKIVEYVPTSVENAKWVEQQAEFVTQRFWACNGYMELYNCILEAFKLKTGVLKVYWESNPAPQFFRYTQVTEKFVDDLINTAEVEITKIDEDVDEETQIPLLDVEGYIHYSNGRVKFESAPMYEFFISRNALSIEDAMREGVHGSRRSATVAEAEALGLTYHDWFELDDNDPEQSDHTESSRRRRGYDKRDDKYTRDEQSHRFLLTEVYTTRDLTGSGFPQLYRFWFGGSQFTYLDHEEVEDSPYCLVNPNPIQHSAIGNSIADLTIDEQDTSTSILRAVVDNAHAANNPRHAADPHKTNFDDLTLQAIGAPIRSRGDTIQTVTIPFTGNGLLPLLQYLDQDVQNKTGITKAAQGLDPDALQSTDKNAVLNTIMTSQGQVELMVRNIIETGLIPAFRKMLRLSIQHMPQRQLLRTKGNFIPVNMSMFDPDLAAVPNVGIGTTSPQQKRAALAWIYQRQDQFMKEMGLNNPFTSYTQMYNTLEDMAEIDGIYDVSRYFKVVTPQVEQRLAEAQQQSAQQRQKEGPVDPSKALVTIESMKQQTKQSEIMSNQVLEERKLALEATKASEEHDLKRDQMAQDRIIKLAELNLKNEDQKIKQEQANNDTTSTTKSGDSGKDNGTGSKTA